MSAESNIFRQALIVGIMKAETDREAREVVDRVLLEHARAVLGLIGNTRAGWLTHSASGTGYWYADTINTYMAEPVVVVSLGAATKETNNDA